MRIYPAIDIFNKKAVRLFQGDFNKVTLYSDPLKIANNLSNLASKYVHIIDLDRAKNGSDCNQSIISEIIKNYDFKVQLGGGLRSQELLEFYAKAGVDRLIIGTQALKDDNFFNQACQQFKEKIVLALDLRDGKIAIKGWQDYSKITLNEILTRAEELKVSTILQTDINNDGVLKGFDFNRFKNFCQLTSINIQASGGVTNLDDIKQLTAIQNLDGIIIGKALYEKRFELKDVLDLVK